MSSMIPESAPFTAEQRAWLNGFFAGLVGLPESQSGAESALDRMSHANGIPSNGRPSLGSQSAAEEEEEFPWHDASLPILDRMAMAEASPTPRRLMAAMAQLDCGSCGYLCQTYAEAIHSGEESNLTLCSPGGKETKQMIKKVLSENRDAEPLDPAAASNGNPSAASQGFNRKNPFTARVIESRPLNKAGSTKDTRHVVIDLRGSALTYKVGDALGIYPRNCDELAAIIIHCLAADPRAMVEPPGGIPKPLANAICEDYCLRDPSDELLELLMRRVTDDAARETLGAMLGEGAPEGFDVLDALEVAPGAAITATEFVGTLAPLTPRLYSIASSMSEVDDAVHLTVGKVVYEREGRHRKGAASTMLAERVVPGDTVRVFIHPNHSGFTIPSDPTTPMIMVGPGTGIAPFIAFLQERTILHSQSGPENHGDNWLFFGDQHEACDFLYEDELRSYLDSAVLTRLDTAFSRDGQTKIYVQDRMRERGAELWKWLKRGAHFYVCGDASRMARDVDQMLTEICAVHGRMSAEHAELYVAAMSTEGRYRRDVY